MSLKDDEKKQLAEKMVAAFLAAGNSSPGPINVNCADAVMHDLLSVALKKENFFIKDLNPSRSNESQKLSESIDERQSQRFSI